MPFLLLAEELLHRSSTAENGDAAAQGNIPGETDRDFVAFHNYGHLPLASRQDKHFLQFLGIFIHIHKNGPVTIGCPGLDAERTGVGSKDDDFVFNKCLLPVANQASAVKYFLLK